MERVAFLIEETGERIGCLLNPDHLVLRRSAGVQARRSAGGMLTGAGLADDPLLYTGGGTTELDLLLLFDVTLVGSSIETSDVRSLTGPLWNLAENASISGRTGGNTGPRIVRFVWGKSWNIPGVLTSVAERLEQFTAEGVPQRSWLRLRLLRVNEPLPQQPSASALPGGAESVQGILENVSPDENQLLAHEVTGDGEQGERLDELAARYFGDSSLWRLLAAFNNIADPMDLPPGTVLRIPPLPGTGQGTSGGTAL
ncbi:MAG: hypothetical protein ABI670_07480 [Chloroflexota bacterium]